MDKPRPHDHCTAWRQAQVRVQAQGQEMRTARVYGMRTMQLQLCTVLICCQVPMSQTTPPAVQPGRGCSAPPAHRPVPSRSTTSQRACQTALAMSAGRAAAIHVGHPAGAAASLGRHCGALLLLLLPLPAGRAGKEPPAAPGGALPDGAGARERRGGEGRLRGLGLGVGFGV